MSNRTRTSRIVLLTVVAAVVVSPVVAANGILQLNPQESTDIGEQPAMSALDVDAMDAVQSDATRTNAAQAASESEPNDDPGNADTLQPGAPISGAVASTSDLDVYALSVPAATTLTVDFGRTSADGTLGVAVYDGQGNFVTGQFVSPNGQTSFAANATQAGTYFVVVGSGSQFSSEAGLEGSGPYTLQVSTAGADDGDDGTGDDDGSASETEPNDDGASADVLQPGVPTRGTIATPDDIDFYTVDVAQPGTVSIELTVQGPQGSGTLVTGLYAPDGTFLEGYFVEAGDTFEFPVQANQPGRYWVIVASGSQFTTQDGNPGPEGTGPYTVQVQTGGPPEGPTPTPTPGDGPPTPGEFATPTPGSGFGTPTPGDGFGTPTPGDGFATPTPTESDPASETEPNDRPQQATVVDLGSTTAGTVDSPDDKDWYAFDASAGQTLNATVTRGEGSGSFRLLYYYPNGTLLADVTPVAPNSQGTLLATIPTNGRYYVRIASPDGGGAYTFSVATLAGGGQGVGDPVDPIGPDIPVGNSTISEGAPLNESTGPDTNTSDALAHGLR